VFPHAVIATKLVGLSYSVFPHVLGQMVFTIIQHIPILLKFVVHAQLLNNGYLEIIKVALINVHIKIQVI